MTEIRVENVVAYTNVGYIELEEISSKLGGAEFDINQFPAILFRPSDLKSAVLIFGNGKVICTGPKSVKEAKKVIDNVIKKLKKAGIEIEDYEIEIENIVASYELGVPINLSAILGLGDVEYKPSQFPGAIWRFENVTALIFVSGKIVLTDTNEMENIEKGVETITKLLSSLGYTIPSTS